ncbi:MAG: hypothetical protein JRI45_06655 [Deltaproteobacteria bacterium]|nr:hypothetical protein [Deltaproteobacteria bacterium]
MKKPKKKEPPGVRKWKTIVLQEEHLKISLFVKGEVGEEELRHLEERIMAGFMLPSSSKREKKK